MCAFEKADLRGGMLLKTRDGGYHLCVTDSAGTNMRFLGMDSYLDPFFYNDDLTDESGDCEYDVVEVWSRSEAPSSIKAMMSPVGRKLLWSSRWSEDEDDECSEPVKMTLDEIEEALGHAIQIVNG